MHVGGVQIGGGAPVVVQSMTCTDTADAQATLAQVRALAQAGCDIVRVSVPTEAALEGFRTICAESPVPIVADIHFNHKLAIGAVEAGAAKLRINPGNIGDWAKVDAVIDAAGAAGCAIRIGVNAGSLEQDIAERDDLTQPEKLVMSSERFVKHFEDRGFTNIVLSAKAHSVQTTLDTYRALSREIPHVPLHLGVTEAGTKLVDGVERSYKTVTTYVDGVQTKLERSLDDIAKTTTGTKPGSTTPTTGTEKFSWAWARPAAVAVLQAITIIFTSRPTSHVQICCTKPSTSA